MTNRDADIFLSQLRTATRDPRPAGRVIQLETGMEISFGCRPVQDRDGPDRSRSTAEEAADAR